MKKQHLDPTANDFSTLDYLGNPVRLSHYKGHRLLISFLRGSICPFCLARVKDLIKHQPTLEQVGIKVLSIIAVDRETIAKSAKGNWNGFPIIADPEQVVFKQFGIHPSKMVVMKAMFHPGKMMQVMMTNPFNPRFLAEPSLLPADFLLDEEGQITNAYYGKNLGDHLDLDLLIELGS